MPKYSWILGFSLRKCFKALKTEHFLSIFYCFCITDRIKVFIYYYYLGPPTVKHCETLLNTMIQNVKTSATIYLNALGEFRFDNFERIDLFGKIKIFLTKQGPRELWKPVVDLRCLIRFVKFAWLSNTAKFEMSKMFANLFSLVW